MPVLDSPESRPLLDYAKNLEADVFLVNASQSTYRPLLDYTK